ncbi:MAG: O-antigen ligase family protein, partial [Actinomycetota bacterium]|nr:O-antigen ligase family protein [Actinomycetota bacterium]
LLLAACLASYVAAGLRALPIPELNAADTGLLRLLAWASILLVANDGIPNEERLIVLLRRISWAGGLLAVFGLVQFFTGQDFVSTIQIPGLTASQSFSGVQDRNGFARAAGTAMSPLEYAAVLSMCLPVALTLAMGNEVPAPLARWLPAASISFALVLSISRSAILGIAVTLLMLAPTWSTSMRRRAAVIGVIALSGIYVLIPGMVGTVRYLFTSISEDSGTLSRTSSYDIALDFIQRSPIVGRGFGTFLPQYRIFDNQYLQSLVEIGFLGLAGLLGVVLTAAICAVRGRQKTLDPLTRSMGQALAAAVLSGAVLTAFFDAFSFPMAAGMLFLTAGVCGGYWRLTERADRTPSSIKVAESDTDQIQQGRGPRLP